MILACMPLELPELKKISELVWRIDKSGAMRVPGIIYASQALLTKIREDKTLIQLRNVACLPGILKHAIVLPDAHEGYGFPIGGVAAFDINEGIISPGGVGYDINCLTGESRIISEFGSYTKIKEFEQSCTDDVVSGDIIVKTITAMDVATINLKSKKTEAKKIEMFLKKRVDEVYEITTEAGLKIRATSEHPFLTKKGMLSVRELARGREVAINTFEGVEHESIKNNQLPIIAKLLGYLFGDGCLYFSNKKGCVKFFGRADDLAAIQSDLKRIGFNSSIYERKRRSRTGMKEFESVSAELHVKSVRFAQIMREFGAPVGNKRRVPDWIKAAPLWIKRLFLAAFFGAVLSTPAAHSKTGFYSPILSQNKLESLAPKMRLFLLDIAEMLKEFGVAITKISESYHKNSFGEKTKRLRLLVSAEEDNLLRLWRTIGFEYNKKKSQLANIACLYILLKKQKNAERKEIANQIKDYRKKGFKLHELKELFKGKVNDRFIERHYYENAGQRISLDFVSFDKFMKEKLEELDVFGVLFDRIENIKRLRGSFDVFDFTVADNHNFIANGFVVSNCGVRLLRTDWNAEQIRPKINELLKGLLSEIPAGVGKAGITALSKATLLEILAKGARWALENGYGTKEDLARTEENGSMDAADPRFVSSRALARGLPQLGTLGSGNHFLEIQRVDRIFDQEIARAFGIEHENQVTVMIHCGSRGLGHQIASDYIKYMEDSFGWKHLPDRELVNAPINSELGQQYYKAMCCGLNYAFCNRQMIAHWTRDVFEKVMGSSEGMRQIYDVCHNLAKFEVHEIDGERRKVCIHRKGGTRSFGPGREEIPEVYRGVGQPVLIPGSMGTASYLLVGTKKAEEVSFGSTAHGAGRVLSRAAALRTWRGEQVKSALERRGIAVLSTTWKGIAEEAPEAYKDIDEVARVSHELGIGKLVARLIPLGVMKG